MLMSRTWFPSGEATSAIQRTPCTLHGQITYTARDGRSVPDRGCVVLALPTERWPDQKLDIAGLSPREEGLAPGHPSLQALSVLGGDCRRTDEQGSYRLTLPQAGTYFLLLLSKNAPAPRRNFPDRKDLAQLGRYVSSAYQLLGSEPYLWREQTIKNDVRFDWEFDRPTD
jgi:hypothetical protein